MTEDQFWHLIDDSRSQGDPVAHLVSALRVMDPGNIVSFNDILSRKIADAAAFPVLAASFVIASYVSDDGFRDFRAWLVSQGRDRYAAVVENPETIADWLEADDACKIHDESILLVARDAFLTHGTDAEFYDRIAVIPDPDIVQAWPASKQEYRERYPRLVDKFWNQRRINELHAD